MTTILDPFLKHRALESGSTHLLCHPSGHFLYAPSPQSSGKWLRVGFAFYEDTGTWHMYGDCCQVETLPEEAIALRGEP